MEVDLQESSYLSEEMGGHHLQRSYPKLNQHNRSQVILQDEDPQVEALMQKGFIYEQALEQLATERNRIGTTSENTPVYYAPVQEHDLSLRLSAISVDFEFLRRRAYPPCYHWVQLEDDEAMQVALLVSKGLSREAAVHVYFKERIHSQWPVLAIECSLFDLFLIWFSR